MFELIDKVSDNAELKTLTHQEEEELCLQIRNRLMDVVSHNGGHLASNLGVVELTVALNRVFDFTDDTVIFDVGHQCYVQKLLSGRNKDFETLRKEDGISGFPKPDESPYDSFIEGHASTSLSQAVGLCTAKYLNGDESFTVAVIGDGALTGGMAYEAMNNIGSSCRRLIVVLNDNSMSISKSVGSLSSYLLGLRYSSPYLALKRGVLKTLTYIPFLGKLITKAIIELKKALRRRVYGGTLFEELGFDYVGPIDGHDLKELENIFNKLKSSARGPYLVHVITTKGKGYSPAEKSPDSFHGVGAFDPEQGNPDVSSGDSFSLEFGRKLNEMANSNLNICAITAAMMNGTGLQHFKQSHPQRFFDVGIAEEHAVTMSAGLSKGGKLPYFCVYSTFLQRTVDQLIHDISLSDMNFVLAIDRAGFVGDDGETHQGLYDVSLLNSVGTFTVISPSTFDELCYWTGKTETMSGPRAIRYPRGREDSEAARFSCSEEEQDLFQRNDSKILLVTYGREFFNVYNAADKLAQKGIKCDVLKLNVILPLSKMAVEIAMKYDKVFFFEEGVRKGGIAQLMLDNLNSADFKGKYIITAVEDGRIKQATVARQLQWAGLDTESIVIKVEESV